MKIILPGGSGQIGQVLARHFHTKGNEVIVLSRTPKQSPWQTVQWDAKTLGSWASYLEEADVVINLAGRSVDCRYHQKNRDLIMNSRVDSTRVIGEAINACSTAPKLWLQASTATIYAHRYDAPNDEATGIIGGDEPNTPETWRFSISVAKAWEQTLDEVITPNTRKVKLRSAMTMSPDKGGVFDTLLTLVRLGTGGSVGNGKQYVSWIHDQDFIRSLEWIIQREDIEGAINLASPNPLPFKDFMRTLRKAWGMPIGLPAAKWMLEIGAFFLRTESELVLKSRRVVPGILLEQGFKFEFGQWDQAAKDLCSRVRSR